MDVAHALGAKIVNLLHLGAPVTPVEALAEAFGRLCERARGDGLTLSIEFVPGSGIPDIATAAAMVRGAGAGAIVLDTLHLARSGGGPADLDPATAALIGSLQLSDRSPEQDLEPYTPMRGRKLPGDGALPLAEIVRRVRAARPDVPIGAEILSEEMDRLGPREGARQIRQACLALMPREG